MSLTAAALLIILVVAVLVGGLLTLRSSAKTGMPSEQVLDRAKRRARELEDQERHQGQDQDR